MDDLISRQAVKELAHNQVREKYCGMALKKQRDFYIKLADSIINLLPSAQPEQRTGKWIKTARWRNVYKCDKCGNYLDFSGVNAGRGDANFCPNCGSRNEVTT